jgi:peptidoglycan/LPS O-acetylase OafA/YrhL
MLVRPTADDAPAMPAAAPGQSEQPQGTAAEIGMWRARTFIPELESMRGIAVLLVFSFHVDRYVLLVRTDDPSLLYSFVRMGHTGVDLFFLLSGFLLSLPFIAYGLGGKPVSLRAYFARRALRILPLYWAAVIFAAVMKASTIGDLAHAIPYLLFLNGFGLASGDFRPYSDSGWWSLATEAQFYVLLPLLGFCLRTRRGRLVGIALLALYTVAYVAMVTRQFGMPNVAAQMAMLTSVLARGPLFLCGISAAALYYTRGELIRTRLARVAWLRNGGADALFIACVVALGVFLQRIYAIGPERQMRPPDQPWHIGNGLLWACILLVILLFPLRSKLAICNSVLSRIGVLSYSIYMIHAPFMQYALYGARQLMKPVGLFDSLSATWAVVAVLAVCCYGLSTLTYRYIEKPFLTRKAKLG